MLVAFISCWCTVKLNQKIYQKKISRHLCEWWLKLFALLCIFLTNMSFQRYYILPYSNREHFQNSPLDTAFMYMAVLHILLRYQSLRYYSVWEIAFCSSDSYSRRLIRQLIWTFRWIWIIKFVRHSNKHNPAILGKRWRRWLLILSVFYVLGNARVVPCLFVPSQGVRPSGLAGSKSNCNPDLASRI